MFKVAKKKKKNCSIIFFNVSEYNNYYKINIEKLILKYKYIIIV